MDGPPYPPVRNYWFDISASYDSWYLAHLFITFSSAVMIYGCRIRMLYFLSLSLSMNL